MKMIRAALMNGLAMLTFVSLCFAGLRLSLSLVAEFHRPQLTGFVSPDTNCPEFSFCPPRPTWPFKPLPLSQRTLDQSDFTELKLLKNRCVSGLPVVGLFHLAEGALRNNIAEGNERPVLTAGLSVFLPAYFNSSENKHKNYLAIQLCLGYA